MKRPPLRFCAICGRQRLRRQFAVENGRRVEVCDPCRGRRTPEERLDKLQRELLSTLNDIRSQRYGMAHLERRIYEAIQEAAQ